MPILQTPQEFYDDFYQSAEHATKSIYAQSMNFEVGPMINKLMNLFIEKAKKGIEVHLNVDWVAQRYIQGHLPLLPVINIKTRRIGEQTHKENEKMYQKLRDAGVHLTITNIPNFFHSLMPAMGRNHIKMYIVDEQIAWLGGINLFDQAFNNVDFMVKFTNKNMIQALTNQFPRVNEKQPDNDYNVSINDSYNLLIDSGKKGQSLIYCQAVDILKQTKSTVVFASQFVPEGKILHELVNLSKRNIDIMIITSSKSNRIFTKYPYKLSYLYFLHQINKQKTIHLHHLTKMVHAKLLICDNEHVLFGSHNMVNSGVLFGTEEIAVKTSDYDLVSQCQQFIQRSLMKYH